MLDGRWVKCEVRVEGTGRTFVPNSIPDDKVLAYVQDFGVTWAGNKMIFPIVEVWQVEEEIY